MSVGVAALQQNFKLPSSLSLISSSQSTFCGTKFTTSNQFKRKLCQPKGALNVMASSSKKILVMGGTRFIGIFLSKLLVEEGHQVTLFTRGKAPVTQPLPGEADDAYNAFRSKQPEKKDMVESFVHGYNRRKKGGVICYPASPELRLTNINTRYDLHTNIKHTLLASSATSS